MTRYAVDDRADGCLVVSIGQVAVLTYVYRPAAAQAEPRRPYFLPFVTLGAETAGAETAGAETAGAETADPPCVLDESDAQLPKGGTLTHRGFTALVAGDEGVEVEEMLQCTSSTGALVFTEKRRLTIRAADDSWSLLFETVLRNVTTGELTRFGHTEVVQQAGHPEPAQMHPVERANQPVHPVESHPVESHPVESTTRREP